MLSQAALNIFHHALLSVDAKDAVGRTVKRENGRLVIADRSFQFDKHLSIYVVAIGKAAYQMALEFDKIAGEQIKGGVVSGVIYANELDEKWQVYAGGHPLPNDASVSSAYAAAELLEQADAEQALVVFLVSGGGSAMMEAAKDPAITLSELRETNRILVGSGASISEINAVRRKISKVKGGGLAKLAPHCRQLTLIISDTRKNDITSVASGPSLKADRGLPDPIEVIEKYSLRSAIPISVMEAIADGSIDEHIFPSDSSAYVLLENATATRSAAEMATGLGLFVKADHRDFDGPIGDGCEQLFEECYELKRSAPRGESVCLISGGEFECRVNGDGIGGRNSETVLRLVMIAARRGIDSEFAFLSAGTDGIDGNSNGAGGIADHTSLLRAREMGLDPEIFLANSDSFTFLNKIGPSIMTGPTGTNVRDIRILLMR